MKSLHFYEECQFTEIIRTSEQIMVEHVKLNRFALYTHTTTYNQQKDRKRLASTSKHTNSIERSLILSYVDVLHLEVVVEIIPFRVEGFIPPLSLTTT